MRAHINRSPDHKMIVEFTGCTSSGKSTLAAEVTKQLTDNGQEAVSSIDLLARSFRLSPTANPTLQNILLDFLLFPFFLAYIRRNMRACFFLWKILFRRPYSFLGAANRWRSVARKIATNEILKKNNRNDNILMVDEGMVHSAHNIFVYSHSPIDPNEIKAFTDEISLPDLLVCTTASTDIILSRTSSRKDLRQVFDPKSRKKEYIERACNIFDEICKAEKIEKRVLVVHIDDHNEKASHEQAGAVLNFILKNIEAAKSKAAC